MTSKMLNRMKYNLFTFILLFALPLFTQANKPQDLLKQGNEFYAKGKYKEAADQYQKVLDAGYQSATLYFNLGNACYKLEEIPQAILNYEKALKMSPGDVDAKLNLQLANLKITDKIDRVPEFFLTEWWRSVVFLFSKQTLAISTVILGLIGFALLIAYLFLIPVLPKKGAFFSGLVLLFAGLVTFILAAVQSHYLTTQQQAIVMNASVDAKGSPNTGSKTLFVIHSGLKVNIRQSEEDWIKVELPNGNLGWIRQSDVSGI